MKSVRVPAYAKVNLRLDVLGLRPDGYHELRTIFQAISLHDTLVLETKREPGIDLRITGNTQLAGEPGRDNLVYRAIHELAREIGFQHGVRAVLTKRIPVGRGLGGGSSDAAAALVGLLRLAWKRIEAVRLLEIASGLGADVPFFLHGGRALGIGRGDEIYPLPDMPRRQVLVISPHDIAVPTKDAYHWLSRELTNGEDLTKLMRFCALCWSPQGGALS
ncbi:MAG TPA: 4-(cytidine 5'-diphospho)-2-C-methyl-D-erythritol kinase, partial [Candidatus Acidoferrales bacterium]|nr:4-(cytidine 5'-diphospho)-2-C-methyl-D-erythritol kinase [Candidatus Acidoferrales bacterium]